MLFSVNNQFLLLNLQLEIVSTNNMNCKKQSKNQTKWNVSNLHLRRWNKNE